MGKKINIAELLEDCPKGTKLYSPIFGEVYLDKIRPHLGVVVTTDKECSEFKEEFLYDGRYGVNGECMLFPSKDETNWEGFQPPFKDGDIVSTDSGDWIGITTGGQNYKFIPTYCVIKSNGEFEAYLDEKEKWSFHKLATEEEKAKLFDAIKDNGYKWNEKTKTLEKLVEPRFKIGNRIKSKINQYEYTIVDITKEAYIMHYGTEQFNYHVPFWNENKFDLVGNKFDINTLKPFESRVLVRDKVDEIWFPCFFGGLSGNNDYPYSIICNKSWKYCIPYKGNEHLLGKADDCDEFYKNW